MDYWMPKLNGATACRHILAKDPAARVILVSAWSPLDGADKSGALSFLSKPVDLDRLKDTLQSIAATFPSPAHENSSNLPSPNSDLPAPISELPAFSDADPVPVQRQSNAGAAGTSDLAPQISPAKGKNSRSYHRRRDHRAR